MRWRPLSTTGSPRAVPGPGVDSVRLPGGGPRTERRVAPRRPPLRGRLSGHGPHRPGRQAASADSAPSRDVAAPASPVRARARAWAELLRLPALFTVPGDVLAGAAAAGVRPSARSTALAVGCSLCLYEAGMALNDWADREEDAAERPRRPLPSGRVRPAAAVGAACGLTAAGLALAAGAGGRALRTAVPLAATVWAYDLLLKRTPAGPAAMAAARGLDLLLGAAATGGSVRPAVRPAALLGAHTLAVTLVSRHETRGGRTLPPLAALATTAVLTKELVMRPDPCAGGPPGDRSRAGARRASRLPAVTRLPLLPEAAPALLYAVTAARPFLHAASNPSPELTQKAVAGGIRAMIPLQAALAARSGARLSALAVAALAPLGRTFARKVSVT